MANIKRVAAGMIAAAAIATAPLVAFAAPAFAATGDGGPGGPHSPGEQHALVDRATTGQSDASHVLVNGASSPGVNAVHCGGGINC